MKFSSSSSSFEFCVSVSSLSVSLCLSVSLSVSLSLYLCLSVEFYEVESWKWSSFLLADTKVHFYDMGWTRYILPLKQNVSGIIQYPLCFFSFVFSFCLLTMCCFCCWSVLCFKISKWWPWWQYQVLEPWSTVEVILNSFFVRIFSAWYCRR